MSSELLPPNSTQLERDLADTTGRIGEVPSGINSLWDPNTCPTEFLPWLAWAFSVDGWNESWTIAQKRSVIAASFAVHKTKGTAGSVKKAVGALGYSTKIVEWYENASDPYTFDVEVEITDTPVDESQIKQIRRVVDRTKNARSHYDLRLVAKLPGQIFIGSALTVGDTAEVYPYQASKVEVFGATFLQSKYSIFDEAEVYPQ